MNLAKLSFKKLSWGAAFAGVALLVGCNLYNPNGASESSCDAGNADCYIALGQSLVQQKSFPEAMAAYKTAIAIDSSKSEAYWGYATAATFNYDLEMGPLLDDLDSASHGNPTSFVNHDDVILTHRLQMSAAVVSVLDILADRDSLTRWYQYLSDSTKKNSDPDYTKRKTFISAYLATSTGSRSQSHFPLTDRKKKFEDNIFQYAPHKLLYTILHTYDIDGNNIFDTRDHVMKNLLGAVTGGSGGLGNVTALADSMKTDTNLRNAVNDKLVELQSGLGDLGEIMNLLQVNASDTNGAKTQSKKQVDSTLKSLGGTLVFYQFGDKLDNDGDGCIDEEIVDSLDNDLDGFYDEDARVFKGNGVNPILPTYTGPADGVDNDRNGLQDGNDASENLLGIGTDETKNWLTFVAQGGGRDFIKIKKDGEGMDYRIRLQADSLAVHLVPGQRPVPGQYAAKLDSAKTLIGGCWKNY